MEDIPAQIEAAKYEAFSLLKAIKQNIDTLSEKARSRVLSLLKRTSKKKSKSTNITGSFIQRNSDICLAFWMENEEIFELLKSLSGKVSFIHRHRKEYKDELDFAINEVKRRIIDSFTPEFEQRAQKIEAEEESQRRSRESNLQEKSTKAEERKQVALEKKLEKQEKAPIKEKAFKIIQLVKSFRINFNKKRDLGKLDNQLDEIDEICTAIIEQNSKEFIALLISSIDRLCILTGYTGTTKTSIEKFKLDLWDLFGVYEKYTTDIDEMIEDLKDEFSSID